MPMPLPPGTSADDQQDYYLWLGSIGWYGLDKVKEFKERLRVWRDAHPEPVPIGNELLQFVWRVVGPATDPVSEDFVQENWSLANVVLYDICDMLIDILGKGGPGKIVDALISAYDVLPGDHRIRHFVKLVMLTRWAGVQRVVKILNSHWRRATRKLSDNPAVKTVSVKPVSATGVAGLASARVVAATVAARGVVRTGTQVSTNGGVTWQPIPLRK